MSTDNGRTISRPPLLSQSLQDRISRVRPTPPPPVISEGGIDTPEKFQDFIRRSRNISRARNQPPLFSFRGPQFRFGTTPVENLTVNPPGTSQRMLPTAQPEPSTFLGKAKLLGGALLNAPQAIGLVPPVGAIPDVVPEEFNEAFNKALASGALDVIAPGGSIITPSVLRALPRIVPRLAPRALTQFPKAPLSGAGQVVQEVGDFSTQITTAFEPNAARRLALKFENVPIIRDALKLGNKSALANDPISMGHVAREQLLEESKTKIEIAMAHIDEVGAQADVFGPTDLNTGFLTRGPLAGHSVNEIAENPSRFGDLVNPTMNDWFIRIRRVEAETVELLKSNGIDIKTLPLDDIEFYAGRTVMHRLDRNGEKVASAFIGTGGGPTGIGAKTGLEKTRRFATIAEAQDSGYVYLPYEDAVRVKLQASYRRVADKRFSDWLIQNLPENVYLRNMKINPAISQMVRENNNRVQAIGKAINTARSAIRGEFTPGATLLSIRNRLPDLAIDLDVAFSFPRVEVDRIIQSLSQELGEATTLTRTVFRDALEQVRLARSGRGMPSAQGRLGVANVSAGELTETIRLVAKDERTANRMLRQIFAEAFKNNQDVRNDALRNFVKRAESLLPAAKESALGARAILKEATTRAKTPALGETSLADIPAFRGKIFAGEGAQQFAEGLRDIFKRPEIGIVFKRIEQLNAVQRVFALAGDASLLGIQLLPLAFRHPLTFGQAAGSFGAQLTRALLDPAAARRFRATQVASNQRLLGKYRGILMSNTNEFTEALRQGGLFAPDSLLGKAAAPLRPFQQAFETAMDDAGIKMLQGLDNLGGNNPSRMRAISDYVNEIRGMTSSQALGIGPKQRVWEGMTLLAPRYRRATAALYVNAMQGGLRGQLARRSLIQFYGGMVMLGGAITIAKGMADGLTPDEIRKEMSQVMNPLSPRFMLWRVGGQLIGPGSKMRSDASLLGKVVTTVGDVGGIVDAPPGQNLLDFSEFRNNPAVKWIRGQLAAVPSTFWDVFSGRNYLGEPINPWNERSEWETLGKEVAENVIPLWLASAAFDGGTPGQRAVRGGGEFFGLRAFPGSESSTLTALRTDELQKRGIRNTDFFDASFSVQREIDALPHIQDQKLKVQNDRRDKGVLLETFRQSREKINNDFDAKVSQEFQDHEFGPGGKELRDGIQDAYRDRSNGLQALESEPRFKSILDFYDELEPSENNSNQALDKYVDLIFDDALTDPVTGDHNYEERDRRLEQLLADTTVAPFFDEIENHLFNNPDSPEIIRIKRVDDEIMRPYLEVRDQILEALELEEAHEEFLILETPLERSLFPQLHPRGTELVNALAYIRKLKVQIRKDNPEMEEALWKWGYITTPRSAFKGELERRGAENIVSTAR